MWQDYRVRKENKRRIDSWITNLMHYEDKMEEGKVKAKQRNFQETELKKIIYKNVLHQINTLIKSGHSLEQIEKNLTDIENSKIVEKVIKRTKMMVDTKDRLAIYQGKDGGPVNLINPKGDFLTQKIKFLYKEMIAVILNAVKQEYQNYQTKMSVVNIDDSDPADNR